MPILSDLSSSVFDRQIEALTHGEGFELPLTLVGENAEGGAVTATCSGQGSPWDAELRWTESDAKPSGGAWPSILAALALEAARAPGEHVGVVVDARGRAAVVTSRPARLL